MIMVAASDILTENVIPSVVLFLAAGAAALVGYGPVTDFFRRREREYDRVLRRALLMRISPRAATIFGVALIFLMGLLGYGIAGLWTAIIGGAIGLLLPNVIVKFLRRRRLNRLEIQLVGGIQTLASGVRAGLNLVQAMQLVARDGPVPLRQEFEHLLREYEYGMPLESAMRNSAARIGSGDFGLLFAALETHRQRGGDLGETLDRIGQSIREIQRLESRVKSLTAQGRATARWLGLMPIIVMAILFFLVDPEGVRRLFVEDIGKIILFVIFLLTAVGFLWVKKIVSIDV
ncbi:MAG: type II secretion system F family protein [Planctomycetota bacterium]|jgi:tight adherence protein B